MRRADRGEVARRGSGHVRGLIAPLHGGVSAVTSQGGIPQIALRDPAHPACRLRTADARSGHSAPALRRAPLRQRAAARRAVTGEVAGGGAPPPQTPPAVGPPPPAPPGAGGGRAPRGGR